MGISKDHLEGEDARGFPSVARTAQRTLKTKGCIPPEECPEWARSMKGHVGNNTGVYGFMLSVDDREMFWSMRCLIVVRDGGITGAQVRFVQRMGAWCAAATFRSRCS